MGHGLSSASNNHVPIEITIIDKIISFIPYINAEHEIEITW